MTISKEPTKEFYVYVLYRPDGRPCYVGKGKGDRIKRHERYAKCTKRGEGKNPHLVHIIKNAGGTLKKEILESDLLERDAFEREIFHIARIGREKNGGPLVNLTDGGEGPSGMAVSEETRKKISRSSKAKWRDPEFKKRSLKAQRAGETPASQEAKVKALRRAWKDPKIRAAISEKQKKNWTDPEFRAKILAAQAKGNTEDVRRARREATKRKWREDSEYREKMLRVLSGNRNLTWTALTPERKAEVKAKMRISAKLRWARVRAEKLKS